ncbi:hypothetical protein ECZU39_27600 [Escherichia coli]|nr:hypothetical protein ECZU39_27600 [Escherichia coli]
MQVAFVGLLPHPIRFWLSSSLIKSHVFTDDNGIPPPKRRTGIAAARRAAKKRRRAKR